jgi:exodeoxyribonuclease-3
MTTLSIASWNVNSVRLRAEPLIAPFVAAHQPDVLCLQEIKCLEEQFPEKTFRAMGYEHFHIRGQKGMHGVAIASKLPLEDLGDEAICPKEEARHQRVGVAGIELHNFYVPAGGDEPDVETNPRFAHKLDFVDRMADYFGARDTQNDKILILGDFNIAPTENDVWSHKQLLKVISHTPVEVEKLNAVLAAGDFIDVAREVIPEPEKIYTWWSYRARDYKASNRGRRLDHIWVTPPLRDAALAKGRDGFRIYEPERGREKPSDHVPVVLDLVL